MTKTNRFTFRATDADRQAVATLAAKLQRSQSDAVRFLVVTAARELNTQAEPPVSQPAQQPEQVTDH
jgi:hypothetical protein